MDINKILALELNISLKQAITVTELFDEGNTVPFIARYRKEATGNLTDELLLNFQARLQALRALQQRKEDVKRLIDNQDKLTDELISKIDNATTLTEVEDIYRPYRPKRRTRATIAKEKGLEKLANYILLKQDCDLETVAQSFIDDEKKVENIQQAIQGAMDIIAEIISDNADYRKEIRFYTFNNGIITTKAKKEEDSVYRMYYDYHCPVKKMVSHRTLAINRGEKEEYLTVKIEIDQNYIISYLSNILIKDNATKEIKDVLSQAISDSYKRLMENSIATEIRNELTSQAESQAIEEIGRAHV